MYLEKTNSLLSLFDKDAPLVHLLTVVIFFFTFISDSK